MHFWHKKKKQASQASSSTPQPSASSATSPQVKASDSSHIEEESSKLTTTATASQNTVPNSDQVSKPPKPPKPKCVRISMLPGDVTETELRSWLLTLEPSQKTGNLQSDSSASEIEDPTKRLIQFHLAPNGKTKQATVTFTTTPAIFDRAEESVMIEGCGKPWDGAVADFHFEGITVAYAPPEGTHIQADIVALSGLGGHALGSWRSPIGWQVWLRDFLPEDMKDVRVLLYGYDTSIVSKSKSIWKEQFHTLAVTMLDSLSGVRDEKSKDRPIIFLGHSLGGLVVEEALIIALDGKNQHELQDISRNSVGALLFGVPHEGIRYWELVKVVANQRNEEFVANLLTDKDTESSALLATQQRHLGRILEANQGFLVVCYWEKYETKLPNEFQSPGQEISRLLVTKGSAMGVGVILHSLEALGINGDHRTIVKFRTRNDEGYKSVLHNIGRIIQQHEPTVEIDVKMQVYLDTLTFPEMNYREQEIREAHTDSCTWILEHDSYTKWINDDSGILGIRGKPGSGKSTLMKKIFQLCDTDKRQSHIQLAFFYHRRGTAMQYSQIGMYQTLLHQLLYQVPSAGAHFWKLAEDKKRWQGTAGKDWEWRLEELRVAFSEVLLAASKFRKLRIFIDALDEAGEKIAQDIILYFRKLNEKLLQSGAHTSICFSCRYFPVITIREGYEVYVEQHNQKDISIYVASELRDMLDFEDRSEKEEEVFESLESSILEKASNVFMWVAITVLLVAEQWNNGESLEDIRQTLHAVSGDLEETYQHILTKVVKRSNLSRTLHLMQWIYLAERPLSVTEIRFALASDDKSLIPGFHSCEQSKEFVESDARMKKLINSLTGGLAEVKTYSDEFRGQYTTVQFIHQSVNDFLAKDQFKCLLPDTYKDAIGQGHDRITRSCINYLKLERIRWKAMSENKLKDVPFIDYSVKFCFLHAEKAESYHVLQTDLITQFEWPSYEVLGSWVDVYRKVSIYRDSDPRCPIQKSTLLHLASSWNLNSVVTELLVRGVDVEEVDQEKNVAMHYAARWGSESVMKILLAAQALRDPRNQSHESPLSKAAGAGHESIVRILLDLGEDINASTGQSGNALQVAAAGGQALVVHFLLDAGADVNAQGGEHSNALYAAAYRNSEAVVQQLLDAGADVNSQGGHFGNALQAAVTTPFGNSEAVLKLLLDAGADVNAQGGQFGTALQAAAQEDFRAVVQLLLDAGADVNAQGGYFGNTLQAAAQRGSVAIVQLLLDAGADVNAQGGHFGNALQAAANSPYESSEATMQLLLDAGAEVNAQGGYYGNALQAAAHLSSGESVQLLLDAGADVNAQGGEYGNALQSSIQGNSIEVVQLLLDAGADVNAQGGYFGNALQGAGYGPYKEIMRLLLDAGADVNAQGGEYGNALQITVYGGSETDVQLLLDAGADVNAQGGQYFNALQSASLGGFEAVVQLLLDAGANVNAQGGDYGNALQAAAVAILFTDSYSAEEMLLDAGVDVDALGGDSGTIVQLAAYRRSEAVVRLLLDAGADVNAQGGKFGNALQAAAQRGSGAVVQLLLDAGADVNAQGGYYGNALQAAANSRYEGSKAVVRQLLDAGADVNAQGGYYGNALQAAADSPYEDSGAIVQLLLDVGADVNAQGGHFGNALQAAVNAPYEGSEKIIQQLLDAGADVNAQGGKYGNALQAAAQRSSGAVVQLLLDSGADVNAQGGQFGNALQAAAAAQDRDSEAVMQLLLSAGAKKVDLAIMCEDSTK